MINAAAIIKEFDQFQRGLNMAQTTIEWEHTLLEWFFQFLNDQGTKRLSEIDTQIVLRYQAHLSQARNRKGNHYNPRTQNIAISTIRKLFRYLKCKGELHEDPAAALRLAKAPRPLPRNVLSVREIQQLLTIPVSLRNRAMLEILYSTGMRQGELRNLDLDDLRPDDQTILIRNGKGGRDRMIPCGKTAWRCILRYLQAERPHLVRHPNEEALFLNKLGTRYSKQGVLVMVKTACKKAGMGRIITPHGIRHATATHLVDAGCDIRFVQELLGHSSPNTTAIYVAVAVRRLKEAHRKFHPRER